MGPHSGSVTGLTAVSRVGNAVVGLLDGLVGVVVVVLLAISAGLLTYALRQARATSVADGPRAWGPPSWELAWVALPLLIVAAIFFLALRG